MGGSLFRRLFSAVVPGRQDGGDQAKSPPAAARGAEREPASPAGDTDVPLEAAPTAPIHAPPVPGGDGPVEVGPFPGPFQHVGFTLAHALWIASTFEGP